MMLKGSRTDECGNCRNSEKGKYGRKADATENREMNIASENGKEKAHTCCPYMLIYTC